ncbi:TetR family transcriptional regulator C-terminal domain-containing protein [Brachybacterium subflavum]|uniref:TetR family transcriptional regulator C-terminal domain-containing protein n=1 Tax=Brachybacterium subflavum TaxID=2585206 RepID=UPI0018790F2B|nr:TetR family transcriptional regulator C-terminal domain-containing protein [Brachybacterium subflavum]
MSSLADRVRERIRRVGSESGSGARAVAMVAELLPLRDDTERELGVWLAFVGRSRHEPALARIVAEQADAVRQFLAGILEDLATLGLRDEVENPRAEAARINALVDGLTLELLTVPGLLTRDEAGIMLREALLPGSASRPGGDQ